MNELVDIIEMYLWIIYDFEEEGVMLLCVWIVEWFD